MTLHRLGRHFDKILTFQAVDKDDIHVPKKTNVKLFIELLVQSYRCDEVLRISNQYSIKMVDSHEIRLIQLTISTSSILEAVLASKTHS